ncbi:MAG: Xylan 1,4-beta-xylosidase [Lacrimispora sp.]|jgi:hypothetical protein|nr:Xylan 1,4-beta-xylosidase [Lacrimispora sp.]
MKKYAVNPYLPSWEYIPDGEPYVFGDRVYVFGSHDFFNGYVFCLGDYVCWSAPVDDLGNWRYEGVIYPKTSDPLNKEGKMCLYAPDVVVGADGRYYLYYVLDKVPVVSVAVCDTPAGRYEFYGYVQDKDGGRLGERPGDQPQFDPGVLREDNKIFLYCGFCGPQDDTRKGAMVTVLADDMITVLEEPVVIVPSKPYGEGTGFEGHEFFEAPSIRKNGTTYYFIYSSVAMHELCYAVSDSPVSGFTYGGVIVSNCDEGIDTYKPARMHTAFAANNHGSLVEIMGKWYIFYHRHTNGTWYSRQGCAEPVSILENGKIPQVEITTSGMEGILPEKERYGAYLACNLFQTEQNAEVPIPKIMQDGRDGDEEPGYIANITDGVTVGFKYFECVDSKRITITTRGYAAGYFEVKHAWDGRILAKIEIKYTNVWENYSTDLELEKGKQAIYLTYRGNGNASLLSFSLE